MLKLKENQHGAYLHAGTVVADLLIQNRNVVGNGGDASCHIVWFIVVDDVLVSDLHA